MTKPVPRHPFYKPFYLYNGGLLTHHYSIQRIRITSPPENEHKILPHSTKSIKQQMETWYIHTINDNIHPTNYIYWTPSTTCIIPTQMINNLHRHLQTVFTHSMNTEKNHINRRNLRHPYMTDCPATNPATYIKPAVNTNRCCVLLVATVRYSPYLIDIVLCFEYILSWEF
jgi:hypothetical protein